MASLNVPCRAGRAGVTGSRPARRRWTAGKNSYQEPNSARSRSTHSGYAGDFVTRSRTGCSCTRRCRKSSSAGATRCARSRRGVAQRAGRGVGARPLGLGQHLAEPLEQARAGLEVVGQILAALPGLDLHGDGVVPGRERVAPRLDGERPLARPVRHDGGVPAVGARGAGLSIAQTGLGAAGRRGRRRTTLAPTASCPSRNTTAEIGTGSPTTARAGNSADTVEPTTGVTSVSPIRPTTSHTVPSGGAGPVAAVQVVARGCAAGISPFRVD